MRPYKCHLDIPSEGEAEIRAGLKTVDARVQSGETEGLEVGDVIRYRNARVRVTRIRRYPSFPDLLAGEDFKKIVPTARTGQQALEYLERNHPVDEGAVGVEAIEFELVEG